jgi:hypothetical protein
MTDIDAYLAGRSRLSAGTQPKTAIRRDDAYSNRPAAWASMV